MGVIRIISVSGGKDSTALYLWAKENLEPGWLPIFADTNHEHAVTVNYVKNLHLMAKGPEVHIVTADFRKRLWKKFTSGHPKRSDGSKQLIDKNFGIAQKDWTSGNVFLDMMLWKGRAPSPRAQFCTHELKLQPIKDWVDTLRGDNDVENYVGIRAQESPRRAKLPEKEFDDFFGGTVFRPLLHWKEEQIYALLEKHGVPPNPLYANGFSRVGCFPCIHARKKELARLPDWAWERLAHWEERLGRTFFGMGSIPGDELPTVDAVRLWSKTAHGGKQLDLNPPDIADVPECMATFGLCE